MDTDVEVHDHDDPLDQLLHFSDEGHEVISLSDSSMPDSDAEVSDNDDPLDQLMHSVRFSPPRGL